MDSGPVWGRGGRTLAAGYRCPGSFEMLLEAHCKHVEISALLEAGSGTSVCSQVGHVVIVHSFYIFASRTICAQGRKLSSVSSRCQAFFENTNTADRSKRESSSVFPTLRNDAQGIFCPLPFRRPCSIGRREWTPVDLACDVVSVDLDMQLNMVVWFSCSRCG